MEQLLDIRQASALLSRHPKTLRNWDNQGVLKAVRVGPRRDRKYRISDLERFLKEGK